MGTQPNVPVVDIEQVKKEIAGLSSEQLVEQLTKLTVRKKYQQKKQQGSHSQKQYQAKQREKFNQMKQFALSQPRSDGKQGTLWDQISEQAEEQAEAKLADETPETEEVNA